MAKRIFQAGNWTPIVVPNASVLTNAGFMGIKGGTTTQYLDFLEFSISGMAGASTPTPLTFARSSTLAVTPTALTTVNSDSPLNPFTAALAAVPVSFIAAGTGGQRSGSQTDAKLQLGINAFGGILRWSAAPGQQFSSFGNAVTSPAGESYLSNENYGTPGVLQASIIYEPM